MERESHHLARDRVFEFNDADAKARFGSFGPDTVAAPLAMPCVFAYEEPVGKAPLLGRRTWLNSRKRDTRLGPSITFTMS
jgi:hypothetical protein